MTKLEDVTLRRTDVGLQGIGTVTVRDVSDHTVTLDLGSWDPSEGDSPIHGEDGIEQEFPGTVVLMEGISLEVEQCWRADVAYIGTNGRQYGDQYYAEFDVPPPLAEYDACFLHKVSRAEGAAPFITEVETEDYTLEEVRKLLSADESPNEFEQD